MQIVTIIIFTVAGRLVSLATAKPIPNGNKGGIAIPLTRDASFLISNNTGSIDLRDAISSHGISVEEKILSGLDNYEMNTGTMHPFAMKWIESSESGLGVRGANVPLKSYPNNMWMGEISIGTPPQTLKMYIDTGSADTWVLQTGCIGIFANRDLWDPNSSKSAEKQEPFQLEYTEGTIVTGDRYTDNVTIGGFTADHQSFGSATLYDMSQLHRGEYPVDGLLGLAFPSVSKFGASPLFESLLKQNKLINPTISFKFTSSGAEMYLGGANSMLYNGDIAYTRITNPGFWQVSMDDVRVYGDKILEHVPAMFDTGANFIFGDWDQVSELYGRIGGTVNEYRGYGYYNLPCNSFPTMSFTFGGKTYEIPPETLRLRPVAEGSSECFSTIVGRRWPRALWSIGIPFLQGVYSVFDYGTLQVGFAKLA